ncbi:mono-functional DNA-alkylating methyl methanesulfonate N-term-domain-containing protein [Mycena vitilis]|nr:mono-functional DNA-alkylating methyl methanesulfonate N-term-domain-containing protein [Mycena vitilis]
MHLYNLTLKHADAALQAVAGNFSGARHQEILVSRGTALEVLRLDAQAGKLSRISSTAVFASIRSIASVRLPGKTKDYIVVGSDSGRLSILEFSESTNEFVKLHQETFGKSGARRIVPGQFLATDPKGRSVMIAAVEKTKLVYTLNRDAAANITISSPLEAQSPGTILHHIVGLDVGFENPMFAALEVNYTESDRDCTGNTAKNAQKMLTLYELDLGLNHVVRKSSEPTDPRANLLVQVPGGFGPSGVLVCCEDAIIYQPVNAETPHRVPIPRRTNTDGGVLIVAATMHKMKSEFGDLYKATLECSENVVRALKIKYFDTVPVGSSLCILKAGFLFVASESRFGNQCLYQFQTLGEDGDETEFSSVMYPSLGMTTLTREYFELKPLRNLLLTEDMPALNPVIQSKFLDSSPSDPLQILAVCGRGPRSTLRILRHGLEVEDIVSCDVKSAPNGLWVTKRTENDEKDTYAILSFTKATLVFSIGEDLVEVQETGFLTTVPTLAVQQLGTDSLAQVHPAGVRHILASGQVREWLAPPGKMITTAATNQRQIVVALDSAEIVYFELDLDGQLNEYEERKAIGSTILALGIGAVVDGQQRNPYLAVGCEDQTLQIFSLEPEHTLDALSIQALTAPASSICIAEASERVARSICLIHIGLQNGVLLQTILDTSTGQLIDTRSRFVGLRPVRLQRIRLRLGGTDAMMALSSRAWINYTYDNQTRFTPLIYNELQYVCNFSHELCLDGFAGVVGNELRIFRLPKTEEPLSQRSIPLSHTPRKIASHPQNGLIYVIESDHRVLDDQFENEQVTKSSFLYQIPRVLRSAMLLNSSPKIIIDLLVVREGPQGNGPLAFGSWIL